MTEAILQRFVHLLAPVYFCKASLLTLSLFLASVCLMHSCSLHVSLILNSVYIYIFTGFQQQANIYQAYKCVVTFVKSHK